MLAFGYGVFSTIHAVQEPEDREMGMTERRSVSIMSTTRTRSTCQVGPGTGSEYEGGTSRSEAGDDDVGDDDYPQECRTHLSDQTNTGATVWPAKFQDSCIAPVSVSLQFKAFCFS